MECSLDIIDAQSRFDVDRYGIFEIQIFFHSDLDRVHLPLRARHIEEIPNEIYDILASPIHG